MKIQLDTNQKVIKLESTVNLVELQEMLEKILPEGEWKEYKLEPCVIQNWSNPIIIDRYVPRTYPWWSITPQYNSGTGSGHSYLSNTTSNTNGIYNLAVKP